ncbi:hypothetical protein [Streptomyces sp. SudanB25_2051]|uniref:hypothetical protein n=1 Tax=Streptomyces sp. SudanB25_2051 TaxID=3035275 RepID=UPI003F54CEDE
MARRQRWRPLTLEVPTARIHGSGAMSRAVPDRARAVLEELATDGTARRVTPARCSG